jgi:hypothetical protein
MRQYDINLVDQLRLSPLAMRQYDINLVDQLRLSPLAMSVIPLLFFNLSNVM